MLRVGKPSKSRPVLFAGEEGWRWGKAKCLANCVLIFNFTHQKIQAVLDRMVCNYFNIVVLIIERQCCEITIQKYKHYVLQIYEKYIKYKQLRHDMKFMWLLKLGGFRALGWTYCTWFGGCQWCDSVSALSSRCLRQNLQTDCKRSNTYLDSIMNLRRTNKQCVT